MLEKRNISTTIIKPGYVATIMTAYRDNKWDSIKVDECSDGILRSIGLSEETNAAAKHLFWNGLVNFFGD